MYTLTATGEGNISGFDESDRFIMGLLRASADAVMVGSGTLHQTTRSIYSSPVTFVRKP